MARLNLGGDLPHPVSIGDGAPLVLIGGPCVIESESQVSEICGGILEICRSLEVDYVFKASFDKANRTSASSARGLGLKAAASVFASG